MLSYILGLIHAFERRHGRQLLQLYLNARHMRQLMEECPGLADGERTLPLGFRIRILPEESLTHPRVVPLECIAVPHRHMKEPGNHRPAVYEQRIFV
jgi:hypothetical protein